MVTGDTALQHDRLAIVIVDDARTGRAFFQRALVPAGYEDVRIAESGARALEMLGERPADVVLADWMMPEMDGLELTARIRELDEHEGHYTALILSTSREGIDALVEAFQAGVDDFLRKPFDARELVARVFAAGKHAHLQNTVLDTERSLSVINDARTRSWAMDTETGLGNRDYFEAQLTTHLMETSMRGGVLCCALADLYSVKGARLDDPLLLARAGRRMMRAVRPIDTVCRLDGARFGLVFSAAEPSGIEGSLIGRLRNEIAQRPVRGNGQCVELDLAFGLTIWEGPGSALSPSDLLARAQRDLADRNAVVH